MWIELVLGYLFIIVPVAYLQYPDIASSKRLRCRLGLDKGNDCPIDGVWSQWKAWGKCTGECGQVGHRTRQRICNNPPPSQDGSQCQGPKTETESCVLQGCTEDEYKKLAAGNPLRSKQFDAMKAVHHEFPVLVGKCLTNDCRYDLVQQLIHDQTKAMAYWNALHCVKYDMGCPVRGGWTPWNAWSPCTAVCGQGFKYRLRNCTKPPPSSKELLCRGNNFENKSCSGIACAPRQDGVWTSWGQWSLCSSPCGPGTRYRVRECVKKPGKRSVETANTSSDGEDALMNLRLAQELDVTNMCAGPNREDQFCHNKDCSVDGQWSNWESWSPCSTECGIGAHFRSRSCSSPPPQGSGKMCPGLVSEVKHCFERPCAVKTHVVAVLNGGGSLLYTSTGRPCRLLHMYVRFFPTSAYGMLVFRYHEFCMGLGCDYVSLALEDNFLVLAAQVSGCTATTISTIKISNGQWHDVMFTVTGVQITLRVDDSPDRSYSSYNCDPVLPNLDQAMRVGERFQGKIQRMSVNFSPVMLRNEAKKGLKDYHIGAAPYGTSSVVYEVGDSEEGYVKLVGKEMITIPCPSNPNQWQVELAVKPDKDNGILLYIPGSTEGDYILATLESGHVRLRYKFGMDQSSAEAQVNAVPGKWLSLYVSRESGEEGTVGEDLGMSVNGESRVSLSTLQDNTTNDLLTCDGDIMVGDITYAVEKLLGSESSAIVTEPLIGTLGFLAMDGVPEDIETLPMEQERGSKFSSRTASFSDSYEEITLLLGQQLNLTCMYGGAHVKESLMKKKDMSRRAIWLHLDVPVKLEASNNIEAASYTVQDDGHATHLKVSAYPTKKSLEGFFLCWSHLRSGGAGKVLVAYGVSLVDPAVEFSSTSIEGMTIVKILSILVLIIYCFILCVQAFTSRNSKYGPFGSTMRRIRGDEISEEEKFMAMLELIRSPQGRLILGSDDAVQESEERLSKAMRLHGGEDVLRTYNSRDNLNISDADLPPLPDRPRRRHKSYTVLKSNAESGYRSLRRKLIKSKSAPKTHDPKREWLLCDDMGSMMSTTVTKADYHSTPQTNKHIELSTFAPEASRKMYNARVDSGSTKYPIRTYNASKEDGVQAKSKISTNIKHSDYMMETKQIPHSKSAKNMNLTEPLRYEINKSDEEYEYNLLTLLPEPKNFHVPKEQAKSETLQQPFLGVTREKSPTKKVKMLFDEVIKKTDQTTLNYQIISENTKTESVGRKLSSEDRRIINSQHKSDQGTQTVTDKKESIMKKMYEEKKNISPDGIHKNITEGAGACQKIKLSRKPAELELNYESSNKGLLLSSSENVSNLILSKKTLEERKVYVKKSQESAKSKTQIKEKDDKEIKMTDVSILSGIKWKKRKIKTKKRLQKKGESKCNPLLASDNGVTHVSTESTHLVPTPAKISEHFLNLDETVKDVLKEST